MFGRATEVSQFNELLVTGQHVKGMRLFDQVSKDPALCNLVLDSVVMSNANQSDPSLHTPHGLQTTNAARSMLAISGFPAGVPLLRFITLYSFSLRKRGLSAEDVRIKARSLPALHGDTAAPSAVRLAEAVETGTFDVVEDQLRALLAARRSDDAVRPLLVAASADPGFLGHTLILAHAIRRAAPFLEPAENFHLFWKAYRTLVSRFGYPEFLRLGPPPAVER